MTQHKVWPIGSMVTVNPNSNYVDQGTREIDGKREYLIGRISLYYEEYGVKEGESVELSTDDHIYWVNWGKAYSDCYRPQDLVLHENTNSSFTFLLEKDLLTRTFGKDVGSA